MLYRAKLRPQTRNKVRIHHILTFFECWRRKLCLRPHSVAKRILTENMHFVCIVLANTWYYGVRQTGRFGSEAGYQNNKKVISGTLGALYLNMYWSNISDCHGIGL